MRGKTVKSCSVLKSQTQINGLSPCKWEDAMSSGQRDVGSSTFPYPLGFLRSPSLLIFKHKVYLFEEK